MKKREKKKKKKDPEVNNLYEKPIYSDLKDLTLRDFTNKFLAPLFTIYLILCIILLVTLPVKSLVLLAIVIITLLANALYTGIQKRDSDSIGDWNCTNIMKRFLYGVFFAWLFSLSTDCTCTSFMVLFPS